MKEKIKYVGAMLICFIAVLFMQMPVLADDGVPATAWRDNAAAAFAGGSGTAADPYLITDGAQLAKVAKDVEDNVTVYKDVYFRLGDTICLHTDGIQSAYGSGMRTEQARIKRLQVFWMETERQSQVLL